MTCAGRFDWTTYSTQFIACVLSICLFILPPILTESAVLGLFVCFFLQQISLIMIMITIVMSESKLKVLNKGFRIK